MADAVRDVSSWLTCPVCLLQPREIPVMQCRNGHIVCNVCKPRLLSCPMCRCPMSDVRNIFAERFLSTHALYDCVNPHCDVRLPLTAIKVHEATGCQFSNIQCPGRFCRRYDTRVRLGEILHHITKEGCCTLLDQCELQGSLKLENFTKTHGSDYCMVIDQAVFFVQAGFHPKSDFFSVWVTILGSEEEASDFYSFIQITGEGYDVNFAAPVVSMFTEFPKLCQKSRLNLNFSDIKQGSRISGQLQLEVKVFKLDENGMIDF